MEKDITMYVPSATCVGSTLCKEADGKYRRLSGARVSAITTQVRSHTARAVIDKTSTSEHGYVPIKLYLQ